MNLKKDTIIYGVPSAFRGLIALLLLPFFTKVLTPEEYGAFTMLTLYNVFLFILFSLGLSNSIGPLYFSKDKSNNEALVISNSVLIAFLGSTLIFLITYFLSDIILIFLGLNIEFKFALIIYSFSAIFKILSLPFDNFLKFESKAMIFSTASISSIAINFILSAVLILKFDMGILGFIYGNLFGDFFFLLVTMIYSYTKIIFKFNYEILKNLMKIGFPMIPSGFVMYMFNEHQRFILEDLSGLSSLGVLTVILSICSVTNIMFGAFGTAWYPFFMSYKENLNEFINIFDRLRFQFNTVFGFICSVFLVTFNSCISLILPKEFIPEINLVVGIVFSQFLFTYSTFFYPIFYFKKKLVFILFSQILSLIISVPITYLFVLVYDLNGLAFSYIFSNVIIMISLYLFSILVIRIKNEKWSYSLIEFYQVKPLLIYLIILTVFFFIDFEIQTYNYLKGIIATGFLAFSFFVSINKHKGTKLNFYGKHI